MAGTSCLRCGADTVSTTANIQINAPKRTGRLFNLDRPAVRQVDALVCPKCGSISFFLREGTSRVSCSSA